MPAWPHSGSIKPWVSGKSGTIQESQSSKGTRITGRQMKLQKPLPAGNAGPPTPVGTQYPLQSMHTMPPTLQREIQMHHMAATIPSLNPSAAKEKVRKFNALKNKHCASLVSPESPVQGTSAAPTEDAYSFTGATPKEPRDGGSSQVTDGTGDASNASTSDGSHLLQHPPTRTPGINRVLFIPTSAFNFGKPHGRWRWNPTTLAVNPSCPLTLMLL